MRRCRALPDELPGRIVEGRKSSLSAVLDGIVHRLIDEIPQSFPILKAGPGRLG
ncbi:hypothetical protein P0O15_07465 [Methanotrichaceae archaeon Mx]|uniref:Uncharacterized protein n=1 Tax=Candidatus Methanocrinis natronophilus TaxID=3033396 RepID=A0ABT5X8H7_9EURY|nr:hypothetical protein [Candidatus Methanocrinis natronophilus]